MSEEYFLSLIRLDKPSFDRVMKHVRSQNRRMYLVKGTPVISGFPPRLQSTPKSKKKLRLRRRCFPPGPSPLRNELREEEDVHKEGMEKCEYKSQSVSDTVFNQSTTSIHSKARPAMASEVPFSSI